MNEKMKMFAGLGLSDLRAANRGHHGKSISEALVSVIGSGKNKSEKYYTTGLSFHARAVKMLGWMKGDKLAFKISPDGSSVCVYRSPDGYTLCSPRHASTGRYYVQFGTLNAEFFKAWLEMKPSNVEIKDGAIAFSV